MEICLRDVICCWVVTHWSCDPSMKTRFRIHNDKCQWPYICDPCPICKGARTRAASGTRLLLLTRASIHAISLSHCIFIFYSDNDLCQMMSYVFIMLLGSCDCYTYINVVTDWLFYLYSIELKRECAKVALYETY
jgi:hypothetical protein